MLDCGPILISHQQDKEGVKFQAGARVSLHQRHGVLKSINNPLQDSVLETTIMRAFTRGIRLPFVCAGKATGEPADFPSPLDFTIRGRKMKDKWQRWKAVKRRKKQEIWLSDDLITWTVSSGTHQVRMAGKIKVFKKIISLIPKSFPYSRTSSEPWNWKWQRFPYKRQSSAGLCSYTSYSLQHTWVNACPVETLNLWEACSFWLNTLKGVP